MPKPIVTPNIIDRTIMYLNPKAGMRRIKERAKYQAMADGGYIGASGSRNATKKWNPGIGSSDVDDLPALPDLRGRSRDHYRNTPLVTGAINTKSYNTIGSGLTLQCEINNEYLGISDDDASAWEKITEFEFKLWADSKFSDAERTKSFFEQQEVAFISTMVSGDVFATMPLIHNPSTPYSLSVMLIEADRVSTPNYDALNPNIKDGIEVDENGAPVKYHISKRHPGDMGIPDQWVSIPAYGENSGRRNVVHLFKPTRPGQKRGVPILAPVMEMLKQLQDYTNAELTAALVSGLFTVFVKTETGEIPDPLEHPQGDDGLKDEDYALGSGAIVGLADGETVETANPGRPNAQFDPFVSSIMKQIASGLDMPFELLLKHFSASYSASRGALLEAWKAFKTRRLWFADNFCQPIYELFLEEAIYIGRIQAPGFFDDAGIRKAYCGAKWNGPTQGQLDPVKETQAAKMRVEEGFSTRTREAAEMNSSDFDQNIKRGKRENEIMDKAGYMRGGKTETKKEEKNDE